jgi:hypothetical protein
LPQERSENSLQTRRCLAPPDSAVALPGDRPATVLARRDSESGRHGAPEGRYEHIRLTAGPSLTASANWAVRIYAQYAKYELERCQVAL